MASTPDLEPDKELVSKLYSAGVHRWEAFEKALDILQAVPHRSSCHYRAIYGVIDSCPKLQTSGSFENKATRSVSEGIEVAQDIFSIKLAVCELDSMNVSIPATCDPLRTFGERKQSTKPTSSFFGFRIQSVPTESMDDAVLPSSQEVVNCKKALYDCPDSGRTWISFTSFRPDVRDLCEASRVLADIQEKFAMYENLTQVVVEVTRAAQENHEGLEFGHERIQAFRTELELFRQGFLQEFGHAQGTLTTFFEQFKDNLETTARESFNAIFQINKAAQESITDLAKDIDKSEVAMKNLQGSIEDVSLVALPALHDDMGFFRSQVTSAVTGIEELLTRQQTLSELTTNTTAAVIALNASLDLLQEKFAGLAKMCTALGSTVEHISRISGKHVPTGLHASSDSMVKRDPSVPIQKDGISQWEEAGFYKRGDSIIFHNTFQEDYCDGQSA
ncbi:MAG: hypothetical protein Q9157_005770 [Trypethelium eluteriae]